MRNADSQAPLQIQNLCFPKIPGGDSCIDESLGGIKEHRSNNGILPHAHMGAWRTSNVPRGEFDSKNNAVGIMSANKFSPSMLHNPQRAWADAGLTL